MSWSCLPDVVKAPCVELESKDIPYGECFVRFHEPRTLVLVNTSKALTGLFRVVPQDPSTFHVARVSPEPEQGQVHTGTPAQPRRPKRVDLQWLPVLVNIVRTGTPGT